LIRRACRGGPQHQQRDSEQPPHHAENPPWFGRDPPIGARRSSPA
jgi:hypothetical protein